ncbi:hypothetical protein GCM10027615_41780 [Plantactinospora veratri]
MVAAVERGRERPTDGGRGHAVGRRPTGTGRPDRGRPRDPGKDSAIHAATVGLLREIGYASLTMGQGSRPARVRRASRYLRWSNKVTLVADTLLSR